MDLVQVVARSFDARDVVELTGGHQARVFAANGGDLSGSLAVRVHEASVDPTGLEARAAVVEVRIAALRVWLDDLMTALVGIRRSDPEWLEVLRRFAG